MCIRDRHLSENINNKERIELLYGDLNDLPSLITAIEKSTPNYVFHLAAQSYPQTSFDAPIETLQTNILATANLLEALRKSQYKNAITHYVHQVRYLEEYLQINYL